MVSPGFLSPGFPGFPEATEEDKERNGENKSISFLCLLFSESVVKSLLIGQ
jgi:hypothetical protein